MILTGLLKIIIILNLLSGTVLSAPTKDNPESKNDTKEKLERFPYEIYTDSPIIPHIFDLSKECYLSPKNKSIIHQIRELDNTLEMIEFMFTFRGNKEIPESVKGKKESKMFKPYFWVRSLGRFSTRLLLLKPNYDVMSFKTLEFRVELFTDVELEEDPKNCLDNLTYNDVENLIRKMLVSDFENKKTNRTKTQITNRVCNLHIHDAEGSDFTFYCCQTDRNLSLTCTYLEEDVWLILLRNAIRVLKAIFFLFFPLLIPKHFYQDVVHQKPFLLKFKRPKKVVVKRIIGTASKSKGEICINSNVIKLMPKFKEKVDTIPPDEEKTFYITEAELEVKDRLVRANDAPVSIFRTLYEHIFHCKLRRLESLAGCCNSAVCRTRMCGLTCSSCERLTWYVFARRLIRILVSLSLGVPWFIRVYVYYKYEHQEVLLRKEAATEKGYKYEFPGNFTLYWSPVHPVFITCYLFLVLCGLMLNFMDKYYTKGVRSVVRKCIQETNEQDRGIAFGNIIKLLLLPFSTYCWGGLPIGIFMWIYLIPLALVLVLFTTFPSINLTFKLLLHLVINALLCIPAAEERTDQDKSLKSRSFANSTFTSVRSLLLPSGNKKGKRDTNKQHKSSANFKEVHQGILLIVREMFKGISIQVAREHQYMKSVLQRLRQALVILVCLVFLYSCVFIGFEMGTFFVDLFIYTFIGLVMYAEYTTTYVSLCVLILLYGKDCFGFVSKQYRTFCSALLDFLLQSCKVEAKKIYFMKEHSQENQALSVHPNVIKTLDTQRSCLDKCDVDAHFEAESFDKLYWRTNQVVFFLTKDDKAKIPYKLFFKACTMNFENKPGRLMCKYFKAALQFLVIVGFLLFVGLVVITFGESNKISATNQLMATVAGGILPFIIKNVLLKRHNDYSSDLKDNLTFQVAVYELLEEYSQKWRVFDIDLKEIDNDDNDNGSANTSDDDEGTNPKTGNGTNTTVTDRIEETSVESARYFDDEERLVVFYDDITDERESGLLPDGNDSDSENEAISAC